MDTSDWPLDPQKQEITELIEGVEKITKSVSAKQSLPPSSPAPSRVSLNGLSQMELIDKIGQLLATLCGSIFAGASLYINLVEHPARMECGTEVAAREFAPSYRRAAIMQASLAILGFLASLLVWLRGNDVWWLVGGLLLVLVVPFTLIVIMPTNRKLLDPSLDKGSDATAKLFSKWAKLHAVRTCLSILALLIFLYIMTVHPLPRLIR